MSHDGYEQRLAYMANQIGKFFASQPPEKAVASIENHLRKFWDPRMRTRIIAHLEAGGEGLDDSPRAAVARLRDRAEPMTPQSNPALTGAKLATAEDRAKGSTEAEPMIPDEDDRYFG